MRDSAIATTVTSLATRIRQSFEALTAGLADQTPSNLADGEPALAGRTWVGLADLPRHTFNSLELDAVYGAVVRCYQRGPREIWAPVLLEMLAPALCERATALFSTLGTVGRDDIEQQLVMEVLRSAEHMPTDDGLRFTDRRLVRDASRRVVRWLRRMNRRQHDSLEQNSQLVVADQPDELAQLAYLVGPGISETDVLLVYRADVRSEPLRQLAIECRVSEEAISSYIRRARHRLRKHLGPPLTQEKSEAA
jgi:DNA-directed RNA polymerase specialized sigma24 family protein